MVLLIILLTFAFPEATKVEEIKQTPQFSYMFFPLFSCQGSHHAAQGSHPQAPLMPEPRKNEGGFASGVLLKVAELE